MKNCILISSVNNKGLGLDSVSFLIDKIQYTYEVTGDVRMKIDIIGVSEFRNDFYALNIAKRFGTLVNKDINIV